MQSLLIWTAYGLAGLFFAGCVVAWWEHLGRERRRQDEPDWEAPDPKAISVDVSLDALAAEGPGDQGERQQALGGALTRMAGAGQNPQRWIDTAPMILPGAAAVNAEPGAEVKVDRRRRDTTAAG
jgi:hypothetical protein